MTQPGQLKAVPVQLGTPAPNSKQQPAAAVEKAGKQDAYVYLSNLPVEAYEGTIRHIFEREGLQVVSQSSTCNSCSMQCLPCWPKPIGSG